MAPETFTPVSSINVGDVVFVVGEKKVGKSHLVRDLTQQMKRFGLDVMDSWDDALMSEMFQSRHVQVDNADKAGTEVDPRILIVDGEHPSVLADSESFKKWMTSSRALKTMVFVTFQSISSISKAIRDQMDWLFILGSGNPHAMEIYKDVYSLDASTIEECTKNYGACVVSGKDDSGKDGSVYHYPGQQ